MCDCLQHFVRVGRANYRCTQCLRDVSLELVLLAEIGENVLPTHEPIIFDHYEKEKQYHIGDSLHIGNNRYKVIDMQESRIITTNIGNASK